MNKVIASLSSKGQIVIPAPMRSKMAQSNDSRDYVIEYIPEKNGVLITAASSFKHIQNLTGSFMSKSTKPLLDPRSFYNSREL